MSADVYCMVHFMLYYCKVNSYANAPLLCCCRVSKPAAHLWCCRQFWLSIQPAARTYDEDVALLLQPYTASSRMKIYIYRH